MIRRAESCRWLTTRWVACALVVAAISLTAGCKRNSANRAGGANTEKAEKARRLVETITLDAIKHSAEVQAKADPNLAKSNKGVIGKVAAAVGIGTTAVATTPPTPTPPKPPEVKPPTTVTKATTRPSSPVVISDRVSSAAPYPTAQEAEADTLTQAQDRIEQRLRELDPPISFRPSMTVVRNEYLRHETRVVRKPNPQEQELLVHTGYSPDRVFVEYDIQITADQIRELRTQDRVGDALRGMVVLSAAALAAFLFLRLDEFTKGYLTSRIAIGAVMLGAAIAAIAVFV